MFTSANSSDSDSGNSDGAGADDEQDYQLANVIHDVGNEDEKASQQHPGDGQATSDNGECLGDLVAAGHSDASLPFWFVFYSAGGADARPF